MTKMLHNKLVLLPIFLLFGAFSAFAQKPTHTFTFKVYINEATAAYYGGHTAIQNLITNQFATVNQFYNNVGFAANYNFSPTTFSYFTEPNSNTQDVLNSIAFSAPETSHSFRILYSRDPKGGSHPNIIGDYNVDQRSIRFCLNAEAEWSQTLFGNIPTRILMHELGHARGGLDQYAGKVVAANNQVFGDVSYEYPVLSIMNNLYDLNASFDAHSIAFMNNTGAALQTSATWRTQFWSMFPNQYSIRVRDQSNNPIPNAKVTLYGVRWLSTAINSSDAFVYYTNAQGKVTFDGTNIAASPFQDQGGSASFFSNFMVVTEYQGSGQYNWMPVYDVQLAKINGQSEYLLDYTYTVTNPSPVTSITSPANNASFNAPANITINANATDNGSISKVEFFNGPTLLGTDNTSPYSYAWNGVAAGNYALTVKAYDNLNASTTSSVVNVVVNTTGGCTDPAWDPAIAYGGGSKVSYNGRKYTSNYWTQNNRPDINCCAGGEEWTDNGPCTGGNVAPTTSITSPANNATFNAPASVTINANAADSDGSISKVEFYRGTTLLNTDNASPYTYTWTGVAAGTYALTVKAYDNSTGITTSSVVNITVNAPNVLPTTSITSPANNATFAAPASVTINANAADGDGSISKVEFYRGTTLLNTDNASPYTYTWTGVTAGTYALTVKAYDNTTGVTTSSAVNITVTGNAVPVTNITSPANNAAFTAPASVTINANATDSDGSISKVEFYRGTTLLYTDNASPYTYTWTNVAAGTYALTVKAFDNSTGITTSSAVNIIVNSTGACTSPQWVAGTGSYTNGTVVKNTVGGVVKKYQCTVAGWCQSTSAFYYEPGNGTAWTSCWTELGVCNSRVGDAELETTSSNLLQVFPNPTNDNATINGNSGEATIVLIKVINAMGAEVRSEEVMSVNGEFSSDIDLINLPQGVYTVVAAFEGKTLHKLLVKN